ncbi:bifunctional phosphopantothenoylcysteine decarboxylase/phosphopantothenate--cysteine ligase CoaBC [bacterium]|nr:bifunctional phosphopantothenoylcysteine decarboxylase/phosphopantothenate--cysteine ligase CoaBC [bacterium]
MSSEYRPLSTKKIVLGITGGIAAYKSVELMRMLQKKGADVHVVMTEHATRFITPLTLAVLSGHKVYCRMFESETSPDIDHIALGDEADLVLIAPATANIIGKLTQGIADDFLSTFCLSIKAPLLIAPAMNWKMFEHQAVQSNLTLLADRGVHIIEPESGNLACQDTGKGRLAPLDRIVDTSIALLTPKTLTTRRILVTAGPTREFWDAFRFLSNPSSGKMGYAIARVARNMGAQVTLISGPTALPPVEGVTFIPVESAQDMFQKVMSVYDEQDVVIMAAAVSDFRPRQRFDQKMKKDSAPDSLPLEMTPDILTELSRLRKRQYLVGFAAETEKLRSYARKKLDEKGIDLIVANRIDEAGSGFQSDTNRVVFISSSGAEQEMPLLSKEEVAAILLERIETALAART